MVVSIDKFWIEGLLISRYPKFLKDKGADLDSNGVIEGSEVFGDLNGDRVIGDQDYKEYLRRNRAILSEKIPFFKWGQRLSVDNRIHQLLYLESDLHPDTQVQSAYTFIADLVDEAKKRIGQRKLSPQEEGQVYYAVMRGAGILFKVQGHSLIGSIEKKQLKCDTSSFVAIAIGDETGLRFQLVRSPLHGFLRGKDSDGKEFNIDGGEITSNESYYKEYPYNNVDSKLVARGGYLKTLDDSQLKGQFLFKRGIVLAEMGKKNEALAAYDEAIKIDPNYAEVHCGRGDALAYLGRNQEALAAYNKAIKINPNFAIAHNNRGVLFRKLGRNKKALAAYHKAIKFNPNLAYVHYNRGLVLKKLGHHKEATGAFQKSLQLGLVLEKRK